MTRDQAMDRIRKLLAMGQDGRGNVNEAETAMRQAQALMRQYQIDSVEEVLADLKGGVDMVRETESPYAYPAVDIPKTVPSWISIIAFGVGQLVGTKCDVVLNRELGARVRFSGYAPDVQFGRWLYRFLIETVHSESVKHGGSRSTRESFRRGAAAVLQKRLLQLVKEQMDAANARAGKGAWDSKSTALVIIDTKKAAVDKAFGAQETKQMKVKAADARAAHAGRNMASKMNLPTNRPLESKARSAAPRIGGSAPRITNKQQEVF